jgi:hypothetical protein
MKLYAGSDGEYYSDLQIWEHLEAGEWTVCCWDPETGAEWVEDDRKRLVTLRPVAEEGLPGDVHIESVEQGTVVVRDADT